MPQLTQISETKKGRYALFFDGEFAFSLDEGTFANAGLHKDDELEPWQIEELRKKSDTRRALDKAMDLLALRDHAAGELYDKLCRRFDPHSAAAAVARAGELGLLNDEDFARRLHDYVQRGGVVVVTYRTAVKDRDNNLVFGKVIPVDLNELLGLYVEETESVQEFDCLPLAGEHKATAGVFRDMIVPTAAQVLYRYDDPFYRTYAAITVNDFGQGAAFYLGTTPDRAVLTQVLTMAMDRAGLAREVLPEGVETVVRQGKDRAVRLVINHNAQSTEAFGLALQPFEVAVIPE